LCFREKALEELARTTLASKVLGGGDSAFFSKMCVEAVQRVTAPGATKVNIDQINILKSCGGSAKVRKDNEACFEKIVSSLFFILFLFVGVSACEGVRSQLHARQSRHAAAGARGQDCVHRLLAAQREAEYGLSSRSAGHNKGCLLFSFSSLVSLFVCVGLFARCVFVFFLLVCFTFCCFSWRRFEIARVIWWPRRSSSFWRRDATFSSPQKYLDCWWFCSF
jgi:hypothetical protein